MLKFFKRAANRNWHPGQAVIRDRWGEAQNRALTTPEFAPKQSNPGDVLNHMRWGLGLM